MTLPYETKRPSPLRLLGSCLPLRFLRQVRTHEVRGAVAQQRYWHVSAETCLPAPARSQGASSNPEAANTSAEDWLCTAPPSPLPQDLASLREASEGLSAAAVAAPASWDAALERLSSPSTATTPVASPFSSPRCRTSSALEETRTAFAAGPRRLRASLNAEERRRLERVMLKERRLHRTSIAEVLIEELREQRLCQSLAPLGDGSRGTADARRSVGGDCAPLRGLEIEASPEPPAPAPAASSSSGLSAPLRAAVRAALGGLRVTERGLSHASSPGGFSAGFLMADWSTARLGPGQATNAASTQQQQQQQQRQGQQWRPPAPPVPPLRLQPRRTPVVEAEVCPGGGGETASYAALIKPAMARTAVAADATSAACELGRGAPPPEEQLSAAALDTCATVDSETALLGGGAVPSSSGAGTDLIPASHPAGVPWGGGRAALGHSPRQNARGGSNGALPDGSKCGSGRQKARLQAEAGSGAAALLQFKSGGARRSTNENSTTALLASQPCRSGTQQLRMRVTR